VSTIHGLPAHVLLVHFIVVLAPLTAGLAILCAIWPAARRRLVWLVLALSLAVLVVTPLTTSAGQWFQHQLGDPPLVSEHANLGGTMLYFSIALFVAAVLLAVLHIRSSNGRKMNTIAATLIAVFVVVAGAATTVQVYRIGDSGAQAVWGNR
jgi:ABC-type branched-subunit amino acid transport system permease subunit